MSVSVDTLYLGDIDGVKSSSRLLVIPSRENILVNEVTLCHLCLEQLAAGYRQTGFAECHHTIVERYRCEPGLPDLVVVAARDRAAKL